MGLSFMRQDDNVVELLRKDHEKVKSLFREFDATDSGEEQHRIVQNAIEELERHAAAEEAVFYPAVRKDAEDAGDKIDESLEEHHVVRLLIAELRNMKPEDERYAAKFRVLAENVRHHLKEEEAELFSRARTGSLDLMALAGQLEQAKASWQADMKKHIARDGGAMKVKTRANTASGARLRASQKRTSKKPARRTAR